VNKGRSEPFLCPHENYIKYNSLLMLFLYVTSHPTLKEKIVIFTDDEQGFPQKYANIECVLFEDEKLESFPLMQVKKI